MLSMMDTISFLGATLALSIVPGPDMTYMVTATFRGGLKVGLSAFAAVVFGCLIHVSLATAGITALLATLPLLFTIIKYAGAAYLLYIAWQIAFAKPSPNGSEEVLVPKAALTAKQAALRALLINIMNPKLSLFFVAFLPQFIDPSAPSPMLQTFTLGIVFVSIGNVFNLSAVLLAAWSAEKIKLESRAKTIAQKTAGLVLGGFAIRLGLSDL